MTEHDLVIHGGRLIDGTGTDPVRANLGIRAGTITAISASDLRGARILDATGMTIAPGFIDLHSHADFRLQGHPRALSQLPQGVTTVVGGNCGFSPFPVRDTAQLRSSSSFFEPDLTWQWTDAAGYARAIDHARPAVNLVMQVGHHAIRHAVLGTDQRPATGADLTRMAAEIARAAEHGVHGFSTGLIYAPGAYADDRELQHLVTAAARAGLLYSTHIRDEGAHLLDAVGEAIRHARRGGARLQVSHLKAAGQAHHGRAGAALDLIDEAAETGLDVAADAYPYTAASTTLTTQLPTWALDGGTVALLRRLDDPGRRAQILQQMRTAPAAAPATVVIAHLPTGPYTRYLGQDLDRIARAEGVDPAEAALRILAAHDAQATVVLHSMDPGDVATVLAHPRVAVASDGWVLQDRGPGRPHPRSFGTFARVVAHYVRDQGVLELPEAVRKMTSLPAARLGWQHRGVLRTGAVADIAVFDAETFTDRATFDDPWQPATGMHAVVVGGHVAFEAGRPTGVRAGRVLGPNQ